MPKFDVLRQGYEQIYHFSLNCTERDLNTGMTATNSDPRSLGPSQQRWLAQPPTFPALVCMFQRAVFLLRYIPQLQLSPESGMLARPLGVGDCVLPSTKWPGEWCYSDIAKYRQSKRAHLKGWILINIITAYRICSRRTPVQKSTSFP